MLLLAREDLQDRGVRIVSRTGELVDIRYADSATIAEFIRAKRAKIVKDGTGRFFFVRSAIDTSHAARRRVSIYQEA